MRKYNVRVQNGREAGSPEGAFEVAQELRNNNAKTELVFKAQILAGGRGKGHFETNFKGGVKVCESYVPFF